MRSGAYSMLCEHRNANSNKVDRKKDKLYEVAAGLHSLAVKIQKIGMSC